MDLINYIERQVTFSKAAFGPGDRTEGIIDHILKELIEIRDADTQEDKLSEWIDVIILGLDGAWRIGASAYDIVQALDAKLAKNMARTWPDWRTAEPGKAIEHDRSKEHSPSCTVKNRHEGWYPSDCKVCEEFAQRINRPISDDDDREMC
jgi:hypothetical protein